MQRRAKEGAIPRFHTPCMMQSTLHIFRPVNYMQIAVHMMAYNVNRFIQPVLRNVEPFVDKIYVAHSTRPYNYAPGARETKVNPTTLEEILAAGIGSKLEIIEGAWLDEESMRNACLDRAKAEGFDWLITQDADEFYQEKSWQRIRDILVRSINEEHYITTWYNFWKSSHYVLMDARGGIKQTNAGFAIRCRPDLKFASKRLTNAASSRVIDYPCYHYGYVMNDAEMLEKISTWGHTQDFNTERWFLNKWINWNESTRNLHPTDPMGWRQAIRFPLEQPDFAEQFALPVSPKNSLSLDERAGDCLYNAKALLIDSTRKLKRSLRATFGEN